jgi:hypothetical protein
MVRPVQIFSFDNSFPIHLYTQNLVSLAYSHDNLNLLCCPQPLPTASLESSRCVFLSIPQLLSLKPLLNLIFSPSCSSSCCWSCTFHQQLFFKFDHRFSHQNHFRLLPKVRMVQISLFIRTGSALYSTSTFCLYPLRRFAFPRRLQTFLNFARGLLAIYTPLAKVMIFHFPPHLYFLHSVPTSFKVFNPPDFTKAIIVL